MSVLKILAHKRNFTEMTSNMIHIVAFGVGVGLKCPHKIHLNTQCTKVRFASFLSGEFTSMAVINPPERKLAKRTSVQYSKADKRH